MENHNAINGKIHYKWAMFNSYVKLPEGTWWFFSATEVQLQEIHRGKGQCAGRKTEIICEPKWYFWTTTFGTDLRWTTVKKNPRDQYGKVHSPSWCIPRIGSGSFSHGEILEIVGSKTHGDVHHDVWDAPPSAKHLQKWCYNHQKSHESIAFPNLVPSG